MKRYYEEYDIWADVKTAYGRAALREAAFYLAKEEKSCERKEAIKKQACMEIEKYWPVRESGYKAEDYTISKPELSPDGHYHVTVKEFPRFVSTGKTPEEAWSSALTYLDKTIGDMEQEGCVPPEPGTAEDPFPDMSNRPPTPPLKIGDTLFEFDDSCCAKTMSYWKKPFFWRDVLYFTIRIRVANIREQTSVDIGGDGWGFIHAHFCIARMLEEHGERPHWAKGLGRSFSIAEPRRIEGGGMLFELCGGEGADIVIIYEPERYIPYIMVLGEGTGWRFGQSAKSFVLALTEQDILAFNNALVGYLDSCLDYTQPV